MRVHIYGLSVTEDSNGYFSLLTEEAPHWEVSRSSIGGIQPNHAKYLFPLLACSDSPDVVIVEWSTGAFRKWMKRESYLEALLVLLSGFHIGSKIVLLDLPRKDVEWRFDWVADINSIVARRLGLGYISLGQILEKRSIDLKGLLRDEVHNSELGASTYAKEIVAAVDACVAGVAGFEYLLPFSGTSILPHDSLASKVETFSLIRGGVEAKFSEIRPNFDLVLALSGNECFRGLSYFMGPTSGELFAFGDTGRMLRVEGYDDRCYYSRISAIECPPVLTRRVTIQQSPDIPSVSLLKGEKNTSARCGGVLSIFLERSGLSAEMRQSKIWNSILF